MIASKRGWLKYLSLDLLVVTHTMTLHPATPTLIFLLFTIMPSLTMLYQRPSVRRFEEANTLYAAVVETEPNNTILLANYALLLCDSLQQYELGTQLANRARSLDPTSPDALRAAAACESHKSEL